MNNWINFIQTVFFQGNCVVCEQTSTSTLCQDCRNTLPGLKNHCRCCSLPLPNEIQTDLLCGECTQKPPAFDRVLTPFVYEPPISQMLAQFKNEHALHQGRILSELATPYIQQHSQGVDLLLPIPLHPKRLAQRGFNQAAELTHWFSKALDIPWQTDVLYRIQDTPSQRQIKRKERMRNVRKAFQVSGNLPNRVALIDDVVTTGATANAAAQKLRQTGVAYIEIWAVARTPKS